MVNSAPAASRYWDLNWDHYYKDVIQDFQRMREVYPFAYLTILPTVMPQLAQIRVVAANKALIEQTDAVESDFLGDFTRELFLIIPQYYQQIGCMVYGAEWVDENRFHQEDLHFFHDKECWFHNRYCKRLCVGVPGSMKLMNNVILENVRTAENMLVAYESVMAGRCDKIDLCACAHGEKGKKQFQEDKRRYSSKEM